MFKKQEKMQGIHVRKKRNLVLYIIVRLYHHIEKRGREGGGVKVAKTS